MEKKDNIIASIKGKPNYIPKYITDRTMELMKIYPNIHPDVHMRNATLQFNRDKALFDDIIEGETKLYKRIYLFGEAIADTYNVVRKFVKNDRFVVEVTSIWFSGVKQIDIHELLTKEELYEED